MEIQQRVPRAARRVAYYTTAIARELIPYRVFEARRAALFAALDPADLGEEVIGRVNYYNRLSAPAAVDGAPRIRQMRSGSTYYLYDLRQYAKAFGPDLHLAFVFGDVVTVPEIPSIVKSRPVGSDNANSVLMKLDRLRHFRWPLDDRAFADKLPRAVWRGRLNNSARRDMVRGYGSNPRFDIGHIGKPFEDIAPKPRLSIPEQFACRYIVSVEGNDVATNLKWIMASNSLCLSPPLRYETWFMEGALKPGVHFVGLREDFADLEEKIDHYERHPEEARAIIANAHAHIARFADRRREDLISLLVLQKYFERTGQAAPQPWSAEIFR